MTSAGPEGELNDDALLQEIDLLADVVVAACAAGRHLTEPELDLALGLGPRTQAAVPPPSVDGAATAS